MLLSQISDYLISAGVGLVIAILIIIGASRGPSQFVSTDTESETQSLHCSENQNESKSQHQLFEEANNSSGLRFNEKQAASKLAPVQKILGLSDEQIREAIEMTNKELNSEEFQSEINNEKDLEVSQALNEFRASEILDIFVYVSGIALIIYFFNSFSDGDFGRMLAGLLPAEAAAINTMIARIQSFFSSATGDDNTWGL